MQILMRKKLVEWNVQINIIIIIFIIIIIIIIIIIFIISDMSSF